MSTAASETAALSFDELADLLERIFVRHGVSPENARILAANCAGCERDGSHSHGIFRIPGYVSSLASGWVDGKAVPVVEDTGGAFIRVDAQSGFTQPAFFAARDLLVERTRQHGIGLLAIRRSHHFSALWPDVEPFADEGLVALSFVNSMTCVVPFGGKKPLYGTNPIAFAAPRKDEPPFVFDLATSAIANGDVQIAAREGRLLPEGMGVDSDGKPTRDPKVILNGGALLAFGGHKGSTIALMVEILGAALTGGYFSGEFDWSDFKGAQTPKTGQLFIVIDPERGGNGVFRERVSEICELTREAGQERLPGDRRLVIREKSLRDGIAISAADHQMLLSKLA
ncbi:Ldh family oxidoreductase [Mesorhizobium sp. CAU 1741]|uniref:Ldh family oxidoreductase n=1 Tax=Mesorhizobium sp. CAU 1741 TaxID=3140366 RepID=UPI00325B537C